MDTRDSIHAVVQLSIKLHLPRVIVSGERGYHPGRDDLFTLESEIHLIERLQRSNHESRPDQQDQRQSDLNHDEQTGRAESRPAPPVALSLPFRIGAGSARAAVSAGANPKSTPVSREMATVNSKMRESALGSNGMGPRP